MARTVIERIEGGSTDVAVFNVTGKLGFHENRKVQRLIKECLKRDFQKVIFDFSNLSSLGGGVAKIFRDFVQTFSDKGGSVGFVVTNEVVLQFLQDDQGSVSIFSSRDDALSGESVQVRKKHADGDTQVEASQREESASEQVEKVQDSAPTENPDVIIMSYDGDDSEQTARKDVSDSDEKEKITDEFVIEKTKEYYMSETYQQGGGKEGDTKDGEGGQVEVVVEEDAAGKEKSTEDEEAGTGVKEEEEGKDEENVATKSKKRDKVKRDDGNISPEVDGERDFINRDTDGILSEIFGEHSPQSIPDWIDKPTSPFDDKIGKVASGEDAEGLNRLLRKRIFELKTLFSISTDFSAIREKKKLLDIFLLTSIAQGGVESAAFFERQGDVFKPVISKGMDTNTVEKFTISAVSEKDLSGESKVTPIENFPIDKSERKTLQNGGFEYICPFRQKNIPAGLVLLGKRIAGRSMKDEDFDFLQILVSIAQGAYENAVMFEREHERTLGIVKTLISLIEENTLLTGTSEFVSRYVGMLAKNMSYPDEHFKDLIYGTVLRDIGMIKVSDLILRSPRELLKDEWEIIKKHPEDGAKMLRRMKFSDHAVEIVKAHHERFNGEGYPSRLQGKEIPFGSRIISVVESYAAMIHERPNRPALLEKDALETLKENYGLRYDREVVAHFVKIMEKEIARSVRPGTAVK